MCTRKVFQSCIIQKKIGFSHNLLLKSTRVCKLIMINMILSFVEDIQKILQVEILKRNIKNINYKKQEKN
jgi:hypothetical protein